MGRIWEKYINRQLYSECQLVTAINAYYYLTGKTIKQDSERYEGLVDLSKARHGSAINIEKVHSKFGIGPIGYSNHIMDVQMDKWYEFRTFRQHHVSFTELKLPEKKEEIRLPIEVNIWHKKTGFHSVLIVDYCSKSDALQITNFRYETSVKGWIFAEDLYKYTNDCNKKWVYRTFGLRQDPFKE